ncbi:glutathione peroxidase [Phycicoccus sp. CSK15P-2]|uniref:glutathione peroxidase n=1 Tax=Phycicoccus sp. CSK15P-2 TaxID=2807627 RepID=UPI001950EE16|nr:glutathione peroxidase [Phycicoccus sp. CSK15P-2]MBM6405670.1 glutathione peroxidase [Phycicoccus sp. CSK15P-2]
MTVLQDFSATTLQGAPKDLDDYAGQVVLVVNTASKCGFTPQYEGLERLWQEFRDQGLVVLGFPCNQFGSQEPGGADEIGEFCQMNYGVTFPMFEKVDVNGDDAHPLFQWLRREARGALGSEKIKWNFTKFLVGRDGAVITRFGSNTKPEKLRGPIEKALGASA